jgi:hypothetical protein
MTNNKPQTHLSAALSPPATLPPLALKTSLAEMATSLTAAKNDPMHDVEEAASPQSIVVDAAEVVMRPLATIIPNPTSTTTARPHRGFDKTIVVTAAVYTACFLFLVLFLSNTSRVEESIDLFTAVFLAFVSTKATSFRVGVAIPTYAGILS